MNVNMLFGFVVFFLLGITGMLYPKNKFSIIYGWIFEKPDLKKSSIKKFKFLALFELIASFIFIILSFIS